MNIVIKQYPKPLRITKIPVNKPKKNVSIAFEFIIPFKDSKDIKSWTWTHNCIFHEIVSRIDFNNNHWNFIKIPFKDLMFVCNNENNENFEYNQKKIIEEITYMKEHSFIENLIDPLWGISLDDFLFKRVEWNNKYVVIEINPIYRMFFDEAGNL